MDSEREELRKKILENEIDINNTESFFSSLYKGLLFDLNRSMKIRGCEVPHIVLNTGDDTMFLEVKGQVNSKEPLEQVNEDYVYNQIPRAMIQFNGMNFPTDQLTSPYSRGHFTFPYNDTLYGLTAEFRRFPITCEVNAKYIFDSFLDSLSCVQQLITNFAFIKNFNITYLGQTIPCTYKIPTDLEDQLQLEFDGLTKDSKNRIVEVAYTVDTNMPVFMPRTVVFEDMYIANPVGYCFPDGKIKEHKIE